ncbi:MAG TPA: cytochrome ubiquinol oxidase subunit I [Smithellaceae bacterium]|jgi:cytochrome d ubiquinol oxidase subunit I|nr:cytochrome ubiquinol oxidase subunit I [Syntrophaceae bacterium]NMD05845.1 cytochrome ubiquinol oxidase subunit I [Deltaproteobacteria bacterium]HOD30744.1 cytochrome ubiquinol oxidase subunit I [Smithellaceae bacterium]MBP8608232.1 cytochrome ubiquinol oxidase subunit I [Syntrophaceae bacterium]HOU04669.1 cytochrome ubiquinol oxidase subunit I [Smithellaceae bacterium]
MDALILARLQFAFTVGFHFLFPAMTLGTSLVILFSETMYLVKKEEAYRKITDFLARILGLIFVVGTATGITMEFSFGMNWSGYSRVVGDIFGPLLAAEAVIAFFLESVFIGVLIFGRNKVSPKVYWLSALLVFTGGHLSAFWILAANSWMQTPAGYEIFATGKIVLSNFSQALLNSSTVIRFFHTVMASWMTCAIMIAGIAGYYVRKRLHGETAKMMLKIGIILFAVTPLIQLSLGHLHAIQVIETQPEKAAVMEGLFETTKGAPLYLAGYVDEQNEKTYGIYIPRMLSILYNFNLNSEIKGLREFPKDNWPPVNLVFQVYHVMVGVGMLAIFMGLLGLFLLVKNKLFEAKKYLFILPYLIPLPHIAHETGWISAEVGRQPWIIYKLMKTADAASVVVSANQLVFSLIMFFLIYSLLFVMFVYLFVKIVKNGPEE